MEKLNIYIPYELYHAVNLNTSEYRQERYKFEIVWDTEGYFLRIKDYAIREKIPEETIDIIIESCKNDPKRAPYLINSALMPIKNVLLKRTSKDPDVEIRLEDLLSKSAGYIQKSDIVAFFSKGALQFHSVSLKSEVYFTLGSDVCMATKEADLHDNFLVFYLYSEHGKIVKLHVSYVNYNNTDTFVIQSIESVETMQYRNLYEQNQSVYDIFAVHNSKSNTKISRLFGKRTI